MKTQIQENAEMIQTAQHPDVVLADAVVTNMAIITALIDLIGEQCGRMEKLLAIEYREREGDLT